MACLQTSSTAWTRNVYGMPGTQPQQSGPSSSTESACHILFAQSYKVNACSASRCKAMTLAPGTPFASPCGRRDLQGDADVLQSQGVPDLSRVQVADFQWHPTQPWTMVSVSDTSKGSMLQLWQARKEIFL